MKNSIFFILILSSVLFACNKQKSVVKKLTGEWSIYSYTFQNLQGLSYKYTAQGSFRFDNCESDYCSYELKMNYIVSGQSYVKNESGTYKVEDDGEYFTLKRINSDGSISILTENRILLINKDQLKLLFQDEIGIHHFILEK